jgi:hypothetical protein
MIVDSCTGEDNNDLLVGFVVFAAVTGTNVRFEVFTAVTMKNGVFLDIKTHFVPHRKDIISQLQSLAG